MRPMQATGLARGHLSPLHAVPPCRRHGIICKGYARTQTPLLESLKPLSRALESGTNDEAVAAAQELKESGVLCLFGEGRQVPKRPYTLEEVRLNRIDPAALLSPVDATMNGVRTGLQAAAASGLLALLYGGAVDVSGAAVLVLLGATLAVADQVGTGGGVEALLLDSAARKVSGSYASRVATHEAGHFLVAYLLGLLPRSYTLSSWDAFHAQGRLGVQAGTEFCDGDFQREVASGKLSSNSLDAFTCLGLAGVCAETVVYGRSEGGLADIAQLDSLLRRINFNQAKADDQVRWSAINDVVLLRRHAAAHAALTKAMQAGKSVAECIAAIEAAEA
ncbi:hypothetical protein ACKKBG_A36110 [Auxenochlorella protothecoides x Auxenochlorella symbiontica]